jgi:SOS response regulatory protein OraA/RecX
MKRVAAQQQSQQPQITKRLEEETESAKKLALDGKRDRALVILKRRKHTQKQLEQIEATQQNIAEMVCSPCHQHRWCMHFTI